MQDQIALLKKLQTFDLKIQAIHSKTGQLRESLDELIALHESLTTSLEQQRKQLEETRAMMRDKELELGVNEERYNHSKSKLNHVSNTREYNALEREMDTLRKMRAQLEEERDSLREAVEGSEADVGEKAEKTASIESQIREEEQTIDKETASSRDEVATYKRERDDLKAKLPKALVRRYEFIASRRPGAAVVAATEGVCTGCNIRLPPQLYNELHVGAKVQQCPSCQRILYYQETEEAAAEV